MRVHVRVCWICRRACVRRLPRAAAVSSPNDVDFDRVLFCFRRAFLVDEYVKEKQLSFDEEGQYRRKMLRKESYYLRLRRQKSHINDFNILTLIGMLLS